MRHGALLSGILHTMLVLLMVIGLPNITRSDRKPVVPVAVEILSLDEFARLPEPRKQVPPKPPLDAPVKPTMQNSPKQTDKSPGPSPISATKTSPPVPVNLKTELLPKPKRKPDSKTRSPKPKPKPKQLVIAAKQKPAPRPKKKPVPPRDKEKAFKSVLKNLDRQKKLSTLRASKTQDKVLKRIEQKTLRSKFERRRIAVELSETITRQVSPCWKIQAGAKNAANIQVAILIRFNRDGSLGAVPQIQDLGRLGNDPFFRAVAESALRALRDPSCVPIKLPLKHYDMWREIVFTFDPREALGQ